MTSNCVKGFVPVVELGGPPPGESDQTTEFSSGSFIEEKASSITTEFSSTPELPVGSSNTTQEISSDDKFVPVPEVLPESGETTDFSSGTELPSGSSNTTIEFSSGTELPDGTSHDTIEFSSGTELPSGTSNTTIEFSSGTELPSGSSNTTIEFSSDGTLPLPKASLLPWVQNRSVDMFTALTPTDAYTATNFVGSITYSIAPALPAGLSFNTSTGVVTGTPTAPAIIERFTVTATGSTSGSATARIDIRVVPASITPETQNISGLVGVVSTPSTAYTATNFSGSVSYSVSPALPSGLSISSSTGVISGTPTVGAAAATYTVTATGSGGGSATATVDLAVLAATITPDTQTREGTTWVEFVRTPAYTATNFLGAVTFSIAPALPAGLTLNTTTGVVSGTPTAVSPTTTYTVTGTGATGGVDTATITLTVIEQAQLIPDTLFLSASKDVPMTATLPFTKVNFVGTVTFSVSPALPAGLLLDTSTGVISGTPLVSLDRTTFTVTGTGSVTGVGTCAVSLAITTLAPSLQLVDGTVGVAITPTTVYLANNLDGTITYSVSPALPAGLTLNTTTGVVSGTPTVAQAQTSYTVTATGSISGTASAIIKINLKSLSPVSQTLSRSRDVAMTPTSALTALNFGGTVTYTISPALPTGLSLDSTTGVISGTPTVTLIRKLFTITATGSVSGTATAKVSLAVTAISPTSRHHSLVPGLSIPQTTVYIPTAFDGTVSYSVSPAFPPGISFNSVTGVFGGTPSVAAEIPVYTVIATGSLGGMSTSPVFIALSTPITQTLNLTQNTTMTPTAAYSPVNFFGSVSFSTDPALPAGLSMNSATGVISGTPTVSMGTSFFKVISTGSGGGVANAKLYITIAPDPTLPP